MFRMPRHTAVLFTLALALSPWTSAPARAASGPDLAAFRRDLATVQKHLDTFDELDFVVFTEQKWDRLHESHAADITVHWPDGHETHGLETHIADLKAMFVYAPDTRIRVHPVKFGSGDWTGVIGVIEGTFTQPMPTGDGKSIPPTGKAFKLQMSTIGHWKNGVMVEEYLFWDNLTFMKQLSLM